MRNICLSLLCALWPITAWGQLDRERSQLPAQDSLQIGSPTTDDERECLKGLAWQPSAFEVDIKKTPRADYAALVSFPSPLPSGATANDTVFMEWHVARDESGQPKVAPAVVVVHESGKGMNVGRIFAQGLRQCEVHAFMVHLPYYGERRMPQPRPEAERLLPTMRQAIADVRRARDAVAALPLVDSKTIAVQGTSLGGFVASTSAGLDGKYDRVFLMLSGGDLFDIIQHGAKDTAKVREQLERAGVTGDQIKELTWNIEPTRLARRLNPDHTWLYSGTHDDVVPIRNAEILAQAIPLTKPHHIRMTATHYSGVLLLPFVIRHVANEVKGR